MSKRNDTNKEGESQQNDGKKNNVVTIDEAPSSGLKTVVPPNHDFDIDQMHGFLEMVFNNLVPEGAHRLVYATTSAKFGPGFPISAGVGHLDKIMRGGKGRAMYFNIASTYPDENGVLRHKRDLFAALHVLVLDDIGTKIPMDVVPKELEPTYIIESSEGNFQYGYVLDTPITDIDHASSLVQVLALADLTDKGGVMATKIVRLPDGINGKDDETKRNFKVKLTKEDGPVWTPEAFLDCLNFEVDGNKITWASILTDEFSPVAKKHGTEFMPLQPIAQTADGIVDPVLEWMYKNNIVLSDSGGDWVELECPWAHEHSKGGQQTAGYSPVGRGDAKYRNRRTFHCFHESCKTHKTPDFLSYVLVGSDLTAIPIHDPTGPLFSNYVFDSANNRVWCGGQAMNIDGFKTEFNQFTNAYVIGKEGKIQQVKMSAAQLWLTSPYRTVVRGAVHDPLGGRLVKDESIGHLMINTYKGVNWGTGDYDQTDVVAFTDYLEYLLPSKAERNYFTDWLAAQVQDPYFRGTGIIMVAENFGIGRSTLGNMLTTLLGGQNTANVDFNELLSPQAYNHWEDKQLIVISESKETTPYAQSKGGYRSYEALKQRIDTTVGEATLNAKYQPHKRVVVCSSYLILTNHTNAVSVPDNDRRLTVLSNPLIPKPTEYFMSLNAWLQIKDKFKQPAWAKSVYRWLKQYDIKDANALMLPLGTEAKTSMSEGGLHGPARAVRALMNKCYNVSAPYIGSVQLKGLTRDILYAINDPKAQEYTDDYITNCMRDETICFANWKSRPSDRDSQIQRVRVFKKSLLAGEVIAYNHSVDIKATAAKIPTGMKDAAKVSMQYIEDNKADMVKSISEELQD